MLLCLMMKSSRSRVQMLLLFFKHLKCGDSVTFENSSIFALFVLHWEQTDFFHLLIFVFSFRAFDFLVWWWLFSFVLQHLFSLSVYYHECALWGTCSIVPCAVHQYIDSDLCPVILMLMAGGGLDALESTLQFMMWVTEGSINKTSYLVAVWIQVL